MSPVEVADRGTIRSTHVQPHPGAVHDVPGFLPPACLRLVLADQLLVESLLAPSPEPEHPGQLCADVITFYVGKSPCDCYPVGMYRLEEKFDLLITEITHALSFAFWGTKNRSPDIADPPWR